MGPIKNIFTVEFPVHKQQQQQNPIIKQLKAHCRVGFTKLWG
jgi:hypothetical protein